MIPALAFTVRAYARGSNLFPLALIFAAIPVALYLLVVLALWYFSPTSADGASSGD